MYHRLGLSSVREETFIDKPKPTIASISKTEGQ